MPGGSQAAAKSIAISVLPRYMSGRVVLSRHDLKKILEVSISISMTPAINAAKKRKIAFTVHQYSHDPANDAYGREAAEKLGVEAARVFKTLVVQLDDDRLAVGVVPVSSMLSMKLMAKAAGAKKAVMADKALVERGTGYVLGGGQPVRSEEEAGDGNRRLCRESSDYFCECGPPWLRNRTQGFRSCHAHRRQSGRDLSGDGLSAADRPFQGWMQQIFSGIRIVSRS